MKEAKAADTKEKVKDREEKEGGKGERQEVCELEEAANKLVQPEKKRTVKRVRNAAETENKQRKE